MADEEKANQDAAHDAAASASAATPEAAEAPSLEVQLAMARDEVKANYERWLRERADLENVKKRAARDKTDAVKFGVEAFVRDLLPVVDNLERAVQHAEQGRDGDSLRAGVELTLRSVRDLLQRHGVSRIATEGQAFDPNVHEAVAHVESADHAPNAVMAEHQAGYFLHDRLLRPALVTVAKSPAAPDFRH